MSRSRRTITIPESPGVVFDYLDRIENAVRLSFEHAVVVTRNSADEVVILIKAVDEEKEDDESTMLFVRIEHESGRRNLYALRRLTPQLKSLQVERRVGYEVVPSAAGAQVTVIEQMTAGWLVIAGSVGLASVLFKLITWLNARRQAQQLQRTFPGEVDGRGHG